MEIVFPVEFVVYGTPVSHQAKRPESREQWKDEVRNSSHSALPDTHFASVDRIAVTLFYFPPEPMQGDIDNIVKLVLDACCPHIYLDDSQVERVVVQKFEPDHLFSFGSPSATFVHAFEGAKPALYIRISNDPHEELQ
ncbi:RusA family crossover junction endodeoxyribonuclease [Mesorhizobium sp. M0488]|uniref:RusA family crossover junction endodeoxyribonuclease n=1 Tax=unclassified Mesorhizobium TaxID=325217 RepID=UPI00333C769A